MSAHTELFDRIRFRGEPVAHPEATVTVGNARFTFLTARLVRLEWSETGAFEDRGTYAFPTRYAPDPPKLDVRTVGGETVIHTDALELHYRAQGERFSADDLSILLELNDHQVEWHPGLPDTGNLRGTSRTLDGHEGDIPLDPGILSRDGWALFDDSASVVFGEDGWVAPRPKHEQIDWYFFGYGHDYKGALAEYARFGGQIPLIPRFILGAWWSRYWAYSEQDLRDLVADFQRYDLPLDVLVIDMDWHTPHAWTGYTWNRELFPDPPAFLSWVHEKGLRATLNLHPAMGVQPFEEIYPRFAKAMGIDPESEEAVPFQITVPKFVQNYFELLHHPMEDEGVDFWWIDWQQGDRSEMEGLDPLTWLNHIHFGDSTRRGQRPMLYSRWGGLGNHRYHIGFSGDTIVGWPALAFQPYFTATASNVAYGWWSHDIGGHMGGATEPELYARWVQFGALSPCLRLHSTKDPRAERRPWAYPDDVYRASRAAFHLRYQLVPYLYTMARIASDTTVPLCRPMYYEHPEVDDAYAARYQYYLGSQAIAAPIVQPADPDTGLAATDVWVPEGTWIDYQTRETFTGPAWVHLVGDINRMPLLVKEGAILPMSSSFKGTDATKMASGNTGSIPHDELVLAVFPGSGAFRLYEDDGTTLDYAQGAYEWTPIETEIEQEQTWTVRVGPVEGACPALPEERRIILHLHGSRQPVNVTIDGEGTREWTYHPESLTTTVQGPMKDKRQAIEISAWNPNGISTLGNERNEAVVHEDVWRLLGKDWQGDAGDIDAVLRTEGPGRADAVARLGGPFVRFVEFSTPQEAAQQLGRAIVGAPTSGDPFDVRLTCTLYQADGPQTTIIERNSCTTSQILDIPFSLSDQIQTQRWEAAIEISWRGQVLYDSHTSQVLFPTIYAWHTLVYDRSEKTLGIKDVLDGQGMLDQALDWQKDCQSLDQHPNVNSPHAVMLWRQYRERLQAGEDLAAYLATTVISPDDREAVLVYGVSGEATIYVNGRQVDEDAEGPPSGGHPMLRETRRTKPIRLHKGENTLLVHTTPPEQGRRFWLFGAAFVEPEEQLVHAIDLAYQ